MLRVLANLSLRQRIAIVTAAIAVSAGLFALVRWRREADFRPLLTGMAPEDAAAVVQKLKETGAEYRLGENGTAVLVPSARLAELRLGMAAAGIPKTGRMGFELFDKANLGTTEFAEHVNYRRALEGELERSVMSLAEIEHARVHLTFPKESVFLEQRQPAKASVLVRLRPGARLAPPNVVAINHLVASAVEGLAPESVSVLDMNGNLLGKPRAAGGLDGGDPPEAALDYRRRIESDLAAKIHATLEPLLGAEKFRAGVSVECDFSGGEQSEEIFDPARSVMLTSQRSEDEAGLSGTGGMPGTASSLPRPAARPASSGGRSSRVTESITYQTSRTVKKMRLPAGGIRKVSIAVLVDQGVSWVKDGDGFRRVLLPPSPETLKVIRDLVAGITGLNAERGDQLIVETLPFETTLLTEPPPSASPAPGASQKKYGPLPLPLHLPLDRKMLLIAGGALAGLVIFGAFIVSMVRRRKRRKPVEVSAPAALPAAETAVDEDPAAIEAGSLEDQLEAKLAERDAMQRRLDSQTLATLKLAPPVTKTAEVFAKHLREKITQDPDVAAHILRSWIQSGDDE